jgi:ubiquitin thioesterase OTU1
MTRKVRIRHAGGTVTIVNFATAKEVAERVREITGIPIDRQVWKCGYPPITSIVAADAALPLEVDSIIVSEGPEPSLSFSKLDAVSTCELPGLPFEIASSSVDPIPVDHDGYVVRRVVDADNSCLFHSVGYAFRQPTSTSQKIRGAVARAVLADPETYSDAFLGRPTNEYAKWIQVPSSWGGQIELSVLSRLLKIEIVALDIIRNRCDTYGKELECRRRIFVIYDGIHYDAVAYCFDQQLPLDMDTTIFSPNDTFVFERALDLCEQEHRRKAFTDTSNFTLRCLVCQQGLQGHASATQHAQRTGHSNFAEY